MLFVVDSAGVPSVSTIVDAGSRTVANTPATRSTSRSTGRPPAARRAPPPRGPRRRSTASMSGGRSDKFCTKVSATRFLEVDLGADQTVSTFVSSHSGAGGELPVYNIRGYRIETRTATGACSTAVTVTGNSADSRTHSGRAAHRALRAPGHHGGRAGQPRRRRADLRVRGLQRRRAAPAPPRPRSPTRTATSPAARSASRSAPTTWRRGNLGLVGDNAHALAGWSRRATGCALCRDPGAQPCARTSTPA